MAKSPTSPRASACFLAETGLLRPDGKPAKSVGPKERVLLSRSMCRYAFVPRAEGLSASQADKSVTLLAESRAPFPDSDSLIQRNVLGYGVWWWDAARVRDLLADKGGYDKSQIAPESLVFEVGSGWRQCITYDGFEAQCWRDFTLIASTWRRRPFTHEQWLSFVESTGAAGADAPAEPPEPTQPAAALKNVQKLSAVEPRKGWATLEGAALSITATSIVGALFFLAQGVHFGQVLGDEQAVIATKQAAAKAAVSKSAAGRELPALQTLADDWARPNPLMVSAAMFKVLKSFNQTPTRWEVKENKLRLETPPGGGAPIGEVARFLERNDYLSNVRPQPDPTTGNAVYVADVCQKIGVNHCGEPDPNAGRAGLQPTAAEAPEPQMAPQQQAAMPPPATYGGNTGGAAGVTTTSRPAASQAPPPPDSMGVRGRGGAGEIPAGYAGRPVDQSNIPADVLAAMGMAPGQQPAKTGKPQ